MRIVLYKGQSQYGSLRLHVDQLAGALARMGHEAIVVDLLESDWIARLTAAISRPVQFFYGFNGMASDLQSEGQSLYERLNAAYISLYVDHPVHLWPRLDIKFNRHIVSFLDRTHVELVRRYFPDDHFAAVSFMPPGANLLRELEPEAFDRWESRSIPLLLTGTYRGEPGRAWRSWEQGFLTQLFDEAVERILAEDMLSVDAALDRVLYDWNMGLSLQVRRNLTLKAVEIHRYIEAYRRHQLLHVLKDAGVPITVYGKGWEPYLGTFRNIDWRGEGSFLETLDLLRQTRLVLNSNNNFVAGGHERVFAAQAAGAAVISDISAFYASEFQEGQDIHLYRWTRIQDVPDIITSALAEPARLARLARAGWERTKIHHSWDVRARHILGLYEAVNSLTR